MKVLILLKGYFPALNYGGPPVSISNFSELLKDKLDIYIVASDHEKGSKERFKGISSGWNERNEAKVMYLREKEINYKGLKKIVKEVDPDLIYVNSFFRAQSTIPALKISKKLNIPCLLAPRGEMCKNAFNMKKYKKRIYTQLVRKTLINNNVYFQATSEEELTQIKKKLKVENSKTFFLDNIPTVYKGELKEINKKENELKLIFLSRIHPKKNLIYAIQVLKHLKGDVVFDIYGYIEDDPYWEHILKEIAGLPSNIRVQYRGVVSRDSIHETFSKYNIFFFPTLSENYGQAIVEAMISNCPVVISDQTPWTEINESKAGWAIPLEDKEKFVNVLQNLVNMDNNEFSKLVFRNKKFKDEKLNFGEIKDEYIKVLNRIINKEV
ncbi:glycosyltransferase [Halobacillus sp. K22]|uniref:glycosyltransferase n=1 Tax=Halobacillus sp. K22 TaxID=3457431 RepID=UPI003FCEE0CE